MKKIRMTENNDCLRACISSLLERNDVPHFLETDEGWLCRLNEWMAKNNATYIQSNGLYGNENTRLIAPDGLVILIVKHKNSGIPHAVIGTIETPKNNLSYFDTVYDPADGTDGSQYRDNEKIIGVAVVLVNGKIPQL